MLLDVGFYTETEHKSFKSYLEEQTEIFVESMQIEAENEWHSILERVGDTEEAGRQIEQWWDCETAAFRSKLIRAYRRQKSRETNRRLNRQQYRIEQLEAKLEGKDAEIERLKGDLYALNYYCEHLQEAACCPECKSRR